MNSPLDLPWYWNPDFLIQHRCGDSLLLKNDRDGAMVSLSQAEYTLLMAFSERNDPAHVLTRMGEYDLDSATVQRVVEKAKELSLLICRDDIKASKQKAWQARLYFIGLLLGRWLSRLTGRPVTAEFNGNLRFFKLFSIDLDGSRLQKICRHPLTWAWAKRTYPLLMVGLGVLPWVHPQASFRFSGFAATHVPPLGLFLAMLLCIFVCLFLHECGHYLVYQRYGGGTDRMGMGFLFLVFPVMYTQIDHAQLWTSTRHRILLSGAGILIDLLVWLAIGNLICFYHRPDFLSLLMDCLFYYYGVQTLTNLNGLFPGTDGYYLIEDLIGRQRLYGDAYESFRACLPALVGKAPRPGKRRWLQAGYYLLCCLNITLYWFLVCLVLTFPLWANAWRHAW